MNRGEIKVDISNKVATITFSHPAGNSMPSRLLGSLETVIGELGSDSKVSVVVLQSLGGEIFCAGANINELAALKNEIDATDFFMGFAHVMAAIKNCPKPVVAKVDGRTVGGGLGIISACDYILASKQATLKLSELSIGIGPFVISDFVERKIGVAGLSQLTLNPFEWHTAQWAKEKGLYFEVFESNEQLDDYTVYFTEKLAALGTDSLKEVKTMLWSSHNDIESRLFTNAQKSGKLVLGKYAQEKISSFINKAK